MKSGETHGLGYERVDDDPNIAVLIATMDATGRWDSTRELRAWERDRLGIEPGQRLLDVGCGLGTAALAFADDIGQLGEIVGLDASAEMVRVARQRAQAAGPTTRFDVGDALALDEPDSSFDAVRSERTLQWLADPSLAVAEMFRVLRRGGRIGLIDTDWSTFRLDIGDDELAAQVRNAMRHERGRPSNVGRRLGDLIGAAGFRQTAATTATQIWTQWNPHHSPAPLGCFSMHSLVEDLVEAGELESDQAERVVASIHHAALDDGFEMSVTMFAVVGVR